MPIEIRELVIRATVEQNSYLDESSAETLSTNGTANRGRFNQLLEQIEELTKTIRDKNER